MSCLLLAAAAALGPRPPLAPPPPPPTFARAIAILQPQLPRFSTHFLPTMFLPLQVGVSGALCAASMEFFSVCSCEDRKSKEAKQPKEAQVETPPALSPAATLQDKDPLFDGLVLARAPRPVDIGRSFENSPPEGSSSPVPRAVAVLHAASDPLSPSPLPSPSSRRSWRHSMAEVLAYPSII